MPAGTRGSHDRPACSTRPCAVSHKPVKNRDRRDRSGTALKLTARGVRYSVGIVGLPEHLAEARAVRAALPPEVYLWVNAAEGYAYAPEEIADWTAVDPLFGYGVTPHAGRGLPCRTGQDVISVRGDGTV